VDLGVHDDDPALQDAVAFHVGPQRQWEKQHQQLAHQQETEPDT